MVKKTPPKQLKRSKTQSKTKQTRKTLSINQISRQKTISKGKLVDQIDSNQIVTQEELNDKLQKIKALRRANAPKVYNFNLDIVMEGEEDCKDELGLNEFYEKLAEGSSQADFEKLKCATQNRCWFDNDDFMKLDIELQNQLETEDQEQNWEVLTSRKNEKYIEQQYKKTILKRYIGLRFNPILQKFIFQQGNLVSVIQKEQFKINQQFQNQNTKIVKMSSEKNDESMKGSDKKVVAPNQMQFTGNNEIIEQQNQQTQNFEIENDQINSNSVRQNVGQIGQNEFQQDYYEYNLIDLVLGLKKSRSLVEVLCLQVLKPINQISIQFERGDFTQASQAQDNNGICRSYSGFSKQYLTKEYLFENWEGLSYNTEAGELPGSYFNLSTLHLHVCQILTGFSKLHFQIGGLGKNHCGFITVKQVCQTLKHQAMGFLGLDFQNISNQDNNAEARIWHEIFLNVSEIADYITKFDEKFAMLISSLFLMDNQGIVAIKKPFESPLWYISVCLMKCFDNQIDVKKSQTLPCYFSDSNYQFCQLFGVGFHQKIGAFLKDFQIQYASLQSKIQSDESEYLQKFSNSKETVENHAQGDVLRQNIDFDIKQNDLVNQHEKNMDLNQFQQSDQQSEVHVVNFQKNDQLIQIIYDFDLVSNNNKIKKGLQSISNDMFAIDYDSLTVQIQGIDQPAFSLDDETQIQEFCSQFFQKFKQSPYCQLLKRDLKCQQDFIDYINVRGEGNLTFDLLLSTKSQKDQKNKIVVGNGNLQKNLGSSLIEEDQLQNQDLFTQNQPDPVLELSWQNDSYAYCFNTKKAYILLRANNRLYSMHEKQKIEEFIVDYKELCDVGPKCHIKQTEMNCRNHVKESYNLHQQQYGGQELKKKNKKNKKNQKDQKMDDAFTEKSVQGDFTTQGYQFNFEWEVVLYGKTGYDVSSKDLCEQFLSDFKKDKGVYPKCSISKNEMTNHDQCLESYKNHQILRGFDKKNEEEKFGENQEGQKQIQNSLNKKKESIIQKKGDKKKKKDDLSIGMQDIPTKKKGNDNGGNSKKSSGSKKGN